MRHGIHSILSWIGVLFISGWLVEVGTIIFVLDMFLLVDLLVGILILLHKISINVGGQCIWERPNSSEIDFNRTRNIKSASTKFVLGSINLLYLLIVIIKLHGLKCMTNSSWWTGPSQYLLYILPVWTPLKTMRVYLGYPKSALSFFVPSPPVLSYWSTKFGYYLMWCLIQDIPHHVKVQYITQLTCCHIQIWWY